MSEKNEDLQVNVTGDYLNGKSVALCVSGGIAAIETPKIARALRRVGASVQAFMTPDASKFIGKAALEWGTAQPVVDSLSGLAEHICQKDAVLVSPATLNTIGKISEGLADSVVTTLVASAIGMKKPVLIAPTMHDSLWDNPFFQRNLIELRKTGVTIIPPRSGEEKKKMPRIETLVAYTCRSLASGPLSEKSLLYTGGPTPVKIDAVRRITNIFRGTLGMQLATDAYLRGADVKLLYAASTLSPPEFLPSLRHYDYDQYHANVFSELACKRYNGGIFSAAVADYRPTNVAAGKIPSDGGPGGLQSLMLEQTPKVIAQVRAKYPDLHMVTFKLESGLSVESLLDIAQNRIAKGYDAVVANRMEDMLNGHVAYLVTKNGEKKMQGRNEIVRGVNDYIASVPNVRIS